MSSPCRIREPSRRGLCTLRRRHRRAPVEEMRLIPWTKEEDEESGKWEHQVFGGQKKKKREIKKQTCKVWAPTAVQKTFGSSIITHGLDLEPAELLDPQRLHKRYGILQLDPILNLRLKVQTGRVDRDEGRADANLTVFWFSSMEKGRNTTYGPSL